MTADNAGTWILEHTPTTFQKMLAANFSYGVEKDEKKLKANDRDHTKWTNPLESRLPNAPSMKLFCVYGHGKETERSYWYISEPHESDDSNTSTETEAYPKDATFSEQKSLPQDVRFARSWIDKGYTNELLDPKVCLRSYGKFYHDPVRYRFETALRWEKATVPFHFSVWVLCVSRVGNGGGGTLLGLKSPQWSYPIDQR